MKPHVYYRTNRQGHKEQVINKPRRKYSTLSELSNEVLNLLAEGDVDSAHVEEYEDKYITGTSGEHIIPRIESLIRNTPHTVEPLQSEINMSLNEDLGLNGGDGNYNPGDYQMDSPQGEGVAAKKPTKYKVGKYDTEPKNMGKEWPRKHKDTPAMCDVDENGVENKPQGSHVSKHGEPTDGHQKELGHNWPDQPKNSGSGVAEPFDGSRWSDGGTLSGQAPSEGSNENASSNVQEQWSPSYYGKTLGEDIDIHKLFDNYAKKVSLVCLEDFSALLRSHGSDIVIDESSMVALMKANRNIIFYEGYDANGRYWTPQPIREFRDESPSGMQVRSPEAEAMGPSADSTDEFDAYSGGADTVAGGMGDDMDDEFGGDEFGEGGEAYGPYGDFSGSAFHSDDITQDDEYSPDGIGQVPDPLGDEGLQGLEDWDSQSGEVGPRGTSIRDRNAQFGRGDAPELGYDDEMGMGGLVTDEGDDEFYDADMMPDDGMDTSGMSHEPMGLGTPELGYDDDMDIHPDHQDPMDMGMEMGGYEDEDDNYSYGSEKEGGMVTGADVPGQGGMSMGQGSMHSPQLESAVRNFMKGAKNILEKRNSYSKKDIAEALNRTWDHYAADVNPRQCPAEAKNAILSLMRKYPGFQPVVENAAMDKGEGSAIGGKSSASNKSKWLPEQPGPEKMDEIGSKNNILKREPKNKIGTPTVAGTEKASTKAVQENIARLAAYAKKAIVETAQALPRGKKYSTSFSVAVRENGQYNLTNSKRQLSEALADAEEVLQLHKPQAVSLMVRFLDGKKVVKEAAIPMIKIKSRKPMMAEGRLLFRFGRTAEGYAKRLVSEGRTCRVVPHNWGKAVMIVR